MSTPVPSSVEIGPVRLLHLPLPRALIVWSGAICLASSLNAASDKPLLANDRVEVQAPGTPATLAHPIEIPLRVKMEGLTTLLSHQTVLIFQQQHTVNASYATLQIQHRGDGGAYVTVMPMALGRVTFAFTGRFTDGALVQKQIVLMVLPPREPAATLIVGQLGTPTENAIKLILAMSGPDSRNPVNIHATNSVNIYAKYETVRSLLHIDPSYAQFKIVSSGSASPISLNEKTGLITALHPGHALLETSFGGHTNVACVVVLQKLETGRSYYERNCSDLLSPGEKLGPSQ